MAENKVSKEGLVQSDESNSVDVLKTLAVLGPLAATILAVTYDVGFFYGIGISFFSFFSLPEHLVFALQSIPFFIPVVLVFSVWYASALIGYRRGFASGTAFVAGLKEEDPVKLAKAIAAKTQRNRRNSLILSVPTSVVLIAAAPFFIIKLHLYVVGALCVVLVILTGIVLMHHFEVSDRSMFTKVGLVACATGATFAVGAQRAEEIINGKTATEVITVEERPIPVRLIRGGDKGVLLFAIESKAIRFLRWDSIKDIRTIPSSS